MKDPAENVMIVDLLRNDLVPTSVPGSVRVTALCEVERTASVMHLVSSVVATVRPDVGVRTCSSRAFPAARSRVRRSAARWRSSPAGARAARLLVGSVFAWEPACTPVASIAIRTATVRGRARYGAGGAVTVLSDAAEEAKETMVKAQPFLEAVNATVAGW